MAAVEAGSGRLDASQARLWKEIKKGYTPFQDGDVLFAKITPCMENGKAALATGLTGRRAAGSTEFHVLRSTGATEPKFVLHFLLQESFRRAARANMKGTAGQLRVPADFMASAEIPLPPLLEQRRIVGEIEKQFTRLEAGVAALRRVLANLQRYRAAVLKAACEGKLVPTEAELSKAKVKRKKEEVVPGSSPSALYETGEQLLQRILKQRRDNWTGKRKYKEPAAPDTTGLPKLPEGWCWATMPQPGKLNRGKSKHRPRDEPKLYSGPYPFIQTGDIRKSGGVVREHSQTYSVEGLKQSRLWPAGTFTITSAANIAETGILTYPACFLDRVVGFVHDGAPATVRYVESFIRTAKEKLAQFAPATVQKNINLDVLQKVAIPLPPVAEQERIVAEVERRLSVVEELSALVTANLQRATRLRQAILQKAFEGKLVK